MNLWDEFEGHGVQFVGVCTSSDHTWMIDDGVDFPAVDDPTLSLLWSYATGSFTYPLTYIIGRDRVITAITQAVQPDDTMRGHIMDAAYKRDPVDVEMVMDVSGSMNDPSPSDPAGDTKLTMMKRAATMITDFLHDHGQVSDRMGLVWFTDDANEYTNPTGDTLLPVPANWSDLRSQINAHGTGWCTAMGAGLQKAFDALSSSTQDRFAILCTDGMQNIEPEVTKVGSHYEIIDSGFGLCGGHSSVLAHPGIDITTYATRVHTIGVGIIASYATLLQEVADLTGGFYQGTNDPDTDLDLIYFLDLCNCLAGGSPAVVYHNVGQLHAEACEATEYFYLNQSVRKITAMLSWKEAQNSDLTFWLYMPGEHLLDLHHTMKRFETHAMATVYLPQHEDGEALSHVGQWKMVIRGETPGGCADYHAFVIAEDQRIKYLLDYPRKVYEVEDILPIRMRLFEAEKPVLRINEIAVETARLRVPLAELLAEFPVSSYELEQRMATRRAKYQSDPLYLKLEAMAAEPRFIRHLTPLRQTLSLKEGGLECQIDEQGILLPVVLEQAGLHSFKVTVHSETPENGPIQRVGMVSVVVGSGEIDAEKTGVNLVEVATKERSGALIRVIPRNTRGQLLGPGFAHELEAKMEEKPLEVKIEDLLDGSYQVEFVVAEKVRKKRKEGRIPANITFRRKLVWKGEI